MNLPKNIRGWTAVKPGARLEEREYPFPKVGPEDVVLEVLYCGVCHSDVHLIDDDWELSQYPLVPGHEILGRVVAVGSAVRNLRAGDLAGVGWQCGSCGACAECRSGNENLCDSMAATCNGHLGGYADYHVTNARFCFPVPPALARPEAAPLFCGGITVYSPLREFLSRKDARVGVLGLGGLGHLAVKFAKAMGYEVSVFSHSPTKRDEAVALGASHFLTGAPKEIFSETGRHFDLLLVTANADLPYPDYLRLLRPDGTLCFVGIPPSPLSLSVDHLLGKRLRVAASPIGAPSRIHEMVQFAAAHEVLASTELLPMAKANEAIARVKKNDVRYRAVLSRA